MQPQKQSTKLQTLIKLAIEKSKINIDKENGILKISKDNDIETLFKSIIKLEMRNILHYLCKELENKIICIDSPLGKLKGSIPEIYKLKKNYHEIIEFNSLTITQKKDSRIFF
jgi:ribosomal protein S4E